MVSFDDSIHRTRSSRPVATTIGWVGDDDG